MDDYNSLLVMELNHFLYPDNLVIFLLLGLMIGNFGLIMISSSVYIYLLSLYFIYYMICMVL
jgi:hypothetical protein